MASKKQAAAKSAQVPAKKAARKVSGASSPQKARSPGAQAPDTDADNATACARAVLLLLQAGGPQDGPSVNLTALQDLTGCKVEIALHYSPQTLLAILAPPAGPDGLTVQQLSERLARIQSDLLGVSVRACTYQNPDGSCAETLTPARKRSKPRK